MLPAQARLRRRPEFTAVVRSGRRAGRPTMVVHYLAERSAPRGGPSATPAGPRVGFVVGRAVGGSVVRHRVTRRLRAAAREQLHRLPPTADVVVRARPEAADAAFDRLRADLAGGLDRVLRGPGSGPGARVPK